MAEWLKAPHSKRGIRHKRIEGSNPSASAMTHRKPWNQGPHSVYSISSHDATGRANMNIMTYVTPVTMHPKRYVLAVYRGTQTHKNIFENKAPFLIQALSHDSLPLVRTLGKKSGLTYDKHAYLARHATRHAHGFAYLDTASFVLLAHPESYQVLDDHDLIIARIEKVILNTGKPVLTTTDLYNKKIIG